MNLRDDERDERMAELHDRFLARRNYLMFREEIDRHLHQASLRGYAIVVPSNIRIQTVRA